MIENHLYSLVTVVKYKLLPCLLAIFLTGCDRTEVTLSFTPEMASFSNEFDFDPLRGPVKDFTQTLMDEQGEVTKRVSGTLSEEGCFDSLELLDLENNTVVALVLDANYYRDAETLEKRVRLQGKCQLAELPSAGVSWETDDNGFVIKASSKPGSLPLTTKLRKLMPGWQKYPLRKNMLKRPSNVLTMRSLPMVPMKEQRPTRRKCSVMINPWTNTAGSWKN